MTGLGREVGAGVERDPLGGQERVERPAAVSRHGLAGLHADRVDVGPLLAIDLDAHEALVHQRGDVGVLEGLVGHHVAPVAGRVADRDEQGPVFEPRPRQGLVTPRIPIDRVVLVLQEVRRGLARQAVGHEGQATPSQVRAIRCWLTFGKSSQAVVQLPCTLEGRKV